MINIQNITKRYGRLEVLRNVSLQLQKGECVALIGPNGCGKTTLIKTILGLVIPQQGHVEFDGKDIQGEESYRRQIGYMPQIGRYPDNMNIDQVMNMVLAVRKEDKIKDDLLFYSFELNKMKKKSMRSLSGGTVQKVSAVLAFMFNPDVLILDEPTAGLDPLSSEILRNKIIEERERGKLVLITSHILSELDDLVTQIVFMHEGQILFHRNVNELLENTGERRISAAISHFLKRQSSD